MSSERRRRRAFDDGVVVALALSLLLHAFVYVAALNACLDRRACSRLTERASNDEIVSLRRTIVARRRPRRARARGVAVTEHTPRSQLAMRGAAAPLRRGQGQYWPLRTWTSQGERWYLVAYRFAYASGTVEVGRVPWPVHFAPGDDPFAAAARGVTLATALPGPPKEYIPPGTLGKALRAYFPQLSFSD